MNCTQSDYKPFGGTPFDGNPFGNKTDIDANLYTTTKNPMNVTSKRPSGGSSIVMKKSLAGLILIINLMIAYLCLILSLYSKIKSEFVKSLIGNL